MIISPPFLPAEGLNMRAEKWRTDPMMDVVDTFELPHSGVFPIAFDRRWHCGMHLVPFGGAGQLEPVRAIADGEVVAYRVAMKAISDGQKNRDGTDALNSNIGFVLLKHVTDTGEGRTITFHSLYMHLLDLVSTNALVPQPNSPAPDSSPNALPAWLLRETNGVKAGEGKKVYRKDQLGFRGQSHGEAHLHFEIFMTEADFTAYFEHEGHKVALGETRPKTPQSKDYWGHTYFVIPEGSTFVRVPAGLGGLKTKGRDAKPLFPPLNDGTLDAHSTLYVQTYFNRGERFMLAWIDHGDGKLVSLTPVPVQDSFAEYEYNLYERATTLYEACPSDGYELLRFGRILSTETPILSAEQRVTWVAVPFADGQTGYIDINKDGIQKLSDADFPFFMNWKKIEDGNTPFGQDGLCGYDALCEIAGVTDTHASSQDTMPAEFNREQQVASYVRGHAEVRAKLKGFICHAKSEWDSSNNHERYGGLNEADGFFGKRKAVDPQGYENFVTYVKKFQFMGQTPLGEGGKFWYFHPTSFIRQFRKCGWLGEMEFKQLVPSFAMRKHSGQMLWEQVPGSFINKNIFRQQRGPMNRMMRMYGINTPLRMASFFGNAIQESQWLQLLEEGSPTAQRYYPWYGRGFLQLTWASNYLNYWDFQGRGSQIPADVRDRLREAQREADHSRSNAAWRPSEAALTSDMLKWRDELSTPNKSDAALSAGFYWVSLRMASYADKPHVLEQVTITASGRAHSYYRSESFWKASASVNLPGAINSLYSGRLNGFEARCMAYNVALSVLTEMKFPLASGEQSDTPEFGILRMNMANSTRLLRRWVGEKKFLTSMAICVAALGLQSVLFAKSLPGERKHALITNGIQNCSIDFIDPYEGWVSGNNYAVYNLPYNKTRIGDFSINFECISSADTNLIRDYTVAKYDEKEKRWEADFSGLSESDRQLLAPVTKWLSVKAVNSSGLGALQDIVTGDPEIRSTSLGFCLLHPPVALCGSAPVVAIPFYNKVGVIPMTLKILESIEFVEGATEQNFR